MAYMGRHDGMKGISKIGMLAGVKSRPTKERGQDADMFLYLSMMQVPRRSES